MTDSKEVLEFKAKTSIQAMALFTEQCKTKTGHEVIKWFERNANDFQKAEFYNIARELLYAVVIDCDDSASALLDIAIELDEAYEEAYDQEGING